MKFDGQTIESDGNRYQLEHRAKKSAWINGERWIETDSGWKKEDEEGQKA